MAKVFYCGGSCGRMGILRAVTALSELTDVLAESSNYAGPLFPDLNGCGPCTVIQIAPGEEEGNWKEGYYRLDKEPLQFEQYLRESPPSAGIEGKRS